MTNKDAIFYLIILTYVDIILGFALLDSSYMRIPEIIIGMLVFILIILNIFKYQNKKFSLWLEKPFNKNIKNH